MELLRKKSWYRLLMISGIVAVAALALFFSGPLGAKAAPDHVTLTWTGDTKTTQTISWRSEFTMQGGAVEYAQADSGMSLPFKVFVAAAEVEGLETNKGAMSIHSATLTGLAPGKRYLYRVGMKGGAWSEVQSFRTAAEKDGTFKFLLFGDSQSYAYGVWQKTLQQAAAANQDAAFMVNVGDLVDVGQDYGQWEGWFDAGKGVIDRLPVVPVVGNHETYTPAAKFSLPTLFTAQLKVPANGPESLKGQVYSFDYANVHFSVLDSQLGEERNFVPDMLQKQLAWLENDLAASAKEWKVVLLHRPPYHNRPKPGDEEWRDALTPLFDKYRVDVVFAGHDHAYARSYPLYGGKIVQQDGTVYVTCGRSGTKTYKAAEAKEWNAFFFNPLEEPNYLSVEVAAKEFKVKVFSQNGTLLDEWLIRK